MKNQSKAERVGKLSPVGAILAAASCKFCFPALAAVGSALGLGVFAKYEPQALIVMQIFIVLSVLFAYTSFRRTGRIIPFVVSLSSGLLLFLTWYTVYNQVVFYAGLFGIMAAAFWNLWIERKCSSSCKADGES